MGVNANASVGQTAEVAGVKFFWRDKCPACPAAKKVVAGFDAVEYLNVDEIRGLAEAAFYSVFSTPSIVLVDATGAEIVAWRGQVPRAEDLRQWL